jgi:bifunctional non-homologous end joining protein LigD
VLSNQDKVFWPDEGYTKGELLTYYEAIAPQLLPQLRGRPVMLVRYPDGVAGKNFYQWNVPQGTPDWVRTLPLRSEERDGKTVTTFLLDDVDALLHIVNLGCIPVHVLACREHSLECCDFVTVDFDLGGQNIQTAVVLALSLRELLSDLGLVAFPKTSGQTGLHVLVPLPEGVPFAAAKLLVELIGHCLQQRHPDVATMERRKEKRGGRVYLDTGQTGRSRTIVSAYSVRAYAGATVSTPLFWEEVHLALRPERYSMFTVPDLVKSRGDALLGFAEQQPDIQAALLRLERWVRPAS